MIDYSGFAFPKPVSVKKAPKILRTVGKKTKERIALYGTESALHDKVWDHRPHVCEVCTGPIMDRRTWCFAHKLAKGQYKRFRYMTQNIALVCSVKCHEQIDKIYQGEERIHLEFLLTQLLEE